MFNYNTGTPCPAPFPTGRAFTSPKFGECKQKQANIFEDCSDEFNDNTTQNIARLVQQEFKNAPPRRSQALAQKPKRNAPISVFDEGSSQRESRLHDGPMKGTINSRPAQKNRLRTSRDVQSLAPSTSSNDISAKPASGRMDNSKTTGKQVDCTNDDRRRTMWIPDDTTILSIHPGAYDQTLNDETIGLPAKENHNMKDITRKGLIEKPSNSGTSKIIKHASKSVSAAPKRGALTALAPAQPNAAARNVLGSGGGKENIPPGTLLSRYGKGEKPLVKSLGKASPLGSKQPQSQQSSLFMQPTAATQAKTANLKKRFAPEMKDCAPKAKVAVIKDPRPQSVALRKESDKLSMNTSSTIHAATVQQPRRAPSKLSIPDVRPSIPVNASRYPVLSDDLCQPELYEDNWLHHQEVALTQLVNGVFQQADQPSVMPRNHVTDLRGKLLSLYHNPAITTLHKRLKASLVYGALSLAKDSPNPPKLREDLGLRRQFLDLFVNSFDLDALQAAAEVVVGRSMAGQSRSSSASYCENGDVLALSKAKELKRFLLTFLIRHEDSSELLGVNKTKSAQESVLQPGTAEWFWQRTVLRSLMLVYLLDHGKSQGALVGCLFQPLSPYKSSVDVLKSFSRLLIASVGDVTRPLGHLDYAVLHVQQPLEEYTYRIDNLAVDLRNGVLLTRLVELLLYPTSALNAQSDCTVTLSLPDGEILTSILNNESDTTWILTRHLKFPCAGRVQKLHNVQVALSALANVRGLTETAVENIKAEDIVDGHREKTLSLLWSLVSRWGLGYLVDWVELRKEIRRFSESLTISFDLKDTPSTLAGVERGVNEQGMLLKDWAASVCQHRHIPVTNLTTSFADGRALSAIISTYAEYVPATSLRTQKSTKRPNQGSTADKLRRLGCSESFIDLFASQTSTIPSRSSTISLLAFLASRLLPLARAHRAACTIQHAYRLRLARRTISECVRDMRAAAECEFVAETKQKELEATIVLQRAWRGVLDRRIQNLEKDILAVQTMARGWAVRNALRGALGGGYGGRRVMGGW